MNQKGTEEQLWKLGLFYHEILNICDYWKGIKVLILGSEGVESNIVFSTDFLFTASIPLCFCHVSLDKINILALTCHKKWSEQKYVIDEDHFTTLTFYSKISKHHFFKGMLIQNSVNTIKNLHSIVITHLKWYCFSPEWSNRRCMKVCLRYYLQWKKILANSFKAPEFFGFIFS